MKERPGSQVGVADLRGLPEKPSLRLNHRVRWDLGGLALILAASILSAVPAWAQNDPTKSLEEWIQQLGSEDARVRDDASRGIEALGSGILPKLKEAHEKADDPEIKSRLKEIIRNLSKPREDKPFVGRLNATIHMEFVWIKPGNFMMGSPADERGRQPDETAHRDKNFKRKTTDGAGRRRDATECGLSKPQALVDKGRGPLIRKSFGLFGQFSDPVPSPALRVDCKGNNIFSSPEKFHLHWRSATPKTP